MNYDLFIVVATIGLLGMVSPGPDFFMVVKNSLNYQRKYALMTCLGVIMGIFTHMSYCIAGIAVLIKTTPWLFTFLRYAGAAYLAWIGFKALLAKNSGVSYVNQSAKIMNVTYRKAFIQGYLCNLLNPKATLFFLAIFTQVLALDSSLMDKLIVAFIIWVEAIIWWPIVTAIFQSELIRRRYFKIQFLVDKLLGVILLGLAIKVAFDY